jgi:hypothetical protein
MVFELEESKMFAKLDFLVFSFLMRFELLQMGLNDGPAEQVSISPTFYAWLFRTKDLRQAFVYLNLRFVLFGAKISAQKLHEVCG